MLVGNRSEPEGLIAAPQRQYAEIRIKSEMWPYAGSHGRKRRAEMRSNG